MKIKFLVRELFNGKTLFRALMNYEASVQEKIRGRVLDMGAGNSHSYQWWVRDIENSERITVDISPDTHPDILADLERPFPFKDESFDAVLAFNLLEHIYNYKNLLSETYRILKTGGKFIGAVPFLFEVHDAPRDFFRYTEYSLSRMLREAGFENINVKRLGYGPFTAVCTLIHLPTTIRLFLVPICILLDKMMPKAHSGSDKWPLGYFFVAIKRRLGGNHV